MAEDRCQDVKASLTSRGERRAEEPFVISSKRGIGEG